LRIHSDNVTLFIKADPRIEIYFNINKDTQVVKFSKANIGTEVIESEDEVKT